jgi:AcrR family transcriptional regulator
MSGSADAPAMGLRERKKIKTRAAIREHAFRLFRENGYTATTIEQIAEAAEVSPSTYFRYFPTKEAVVLTDDLDSVVVGAMAGIPLELPPLAAIREGLRRAFANLDSDLMDFERERQSVIRAEPELRSTMLDELTRNIAMLAGVVAARTGRNENDFEIRVFAGAVVGAMLPTLNHGVDATFDFSQIDRALALLEAGLPL